MKKEYLTTVVIIDKTIRQISNRGFTIKNDWRKLLVAFNVISY